MFPIFLIKSWLILLGYFWSNPDAFLRSFWTKSAPKKEPTLHLLESRLWRSCGGARDSIRLYNPSSHFKLRTMMIYDEIWFNVVFTHVTYELLGVPCWCPKLPGRSHWKPPYRGRNSSTAFASPRRVWRNKFFFFGSACLGRSRAFGDIWRDVKWLFRPP